MSQLDRATRRRLVAAVAGTAALAVTACSPPQPGSAASSVTIAETTAPSTLDPQGSGLFADRFAWQLSYECLLTTSADGTVKPALASDWKKSDDGLTYTFTLRPDVKFHNGETLTADDVVFTFERLKKSPDGIDTELFPTWSDVTAIDKSTVQFRLKAPDAGFVNNMANPLVWGCAIMSSKAAESGNPDTTMVGTGPWQQVSYRADSELKFQRFGDYWGTPAASEKLNVLYMPNIATQVSNLKAGKVDLIFPDSASAASLKGNDKIVVDKAETDSTIFLQINNMAKPFDNQLVRQALALAVNREELAEKAYNGGARPSVYVPPSNAWAPKPSGLPNSTRDVAEAKRLLTEAGYPKGFATTLMYISGYDPGTDNMMALMQHQLAEVGIRVELVPLEAAAWSDKLTKPDYALSWNAQSYYSNPYQYIAPAPGRQGPVPASLQKLLDAALAAKDQESYQKALVAVEEEEARTVYPTITLLATDMYAAHDSALTGVEVPPSQSRTFLAQVKHD
ncbi:glutathione transport system substrate-binding protein [Micromonospora viridifaciens]|uniref:Glutathione transport system substrate-binding protein n=1 Tax=Micromonospora viridifaciens TaxID=1881 RepID=A0A1C4WSC5_MICVI|nr:ABC transporter substrate-binding protein [Micromonospora viridifaciens]SCE99196.1 glutathione transport system substrate-binding protein [Micromonospora viridifaciens]